MRNCLVALLLAASAAALLTPRVSLAAPAADASMSVTCPPPFNGAPDYPQIIQRAGIGGSATIIVDTDDCGRVLRAVLENSSLNPELDSEALAATRRWVLPEATTHNPPQADGSYRVRVPVVFDPLERARRSEHVTEDACRERRVSGKIAPPFDAEGAAIERLTVDDPCPIGYGQIAQALHYVRANAWFTASWFMDPMKGGMALEEYRVFDGDGINDWVFLKDAEGTYRVALRSRSVSDGGYRYAAQSRLCELPEAQCQAVFERMKLLWGNKMRVPVAAEVAP